MRSMFRAAAVAAVLVVGLAACGDDDDSDEASSEAAGETTTTTEAGLPAEACDAVLAVGTALTSGPEGPPTPEYLEGELLPTVEAVEATGAEELAGPAEAMRAAIDAALAGDEAAEDQAFGAYGEMTAAVHTGCGFETADVTAVDYAFEGLPEEMPAGQVSIAMTNEGDEEHEMVLFRRNDGETRGIEELLELPEAEAEEAVTFSGVTFAPPGETGYLATELEPGTYFSVCFIPVGGAEDGPPHFTEGMAAQFEVT